MFPWFCVCGSVPIYDFLNISCLCFTYFLFVLRRLMLTKALITIREVALRLHHVKVNFDDVRLFYKVKQELENIFVSICQSISQQTKNKQRKLRYFTNKKI